MISRDNAANMTKVIDDMTTTTNVFIPVFSCFLVF